LTKIYLPDKLLTFEVARVFFLEFARSRSEL